MKAKIFAVVLLELSVNLAQAKPLTSKTPSLKATTKLPIAQAKTAIKNGELHFTFAKDSSVLAKNSEQKAHDLLENVKQGETIAILVYSLNIDNFDKNSFLRDARGRAVKNLFIHMGVPENQITLIYPGTTDSNSTDIIASIYDESQKEKVATAVESYWYVSDDSYQKRPNVFLENGILKFYFDEVGADIPDYDFSQAMYLIDNIKQGKKIGIVAYNNPNDKKPFDMILAKKRAVAVKNFLIKNGVPTEQIYLMKLISSNIENSLSRFEVQILEQE